jgi:hypothetical protein
MLGRVAYGAPWSAPQILEQQGPGPFRLHTQVMAHAAQVPHPPAAPLTSVRGAHASRRHGGHVAPTPSSCCGSWADEPRTGRTGGQATRHATTMLPLAPDAGACIRGIPPRGRGRNCHPAGANHPTCRAQNIPHAVPNNPTRPDRTSFQRHDKAAQHHVALTAGHPLLPSAPGHPLHSRSARHPNA